MSVVGRFIVLISMIFFLAAGPVYADEDAVIATVNAEYDAGNIETRTVRDNMILMLNDAKYAADVDEHIALVDAFRIMVSSFSGDTVTTDAATRILAAASNL